MNQHCPHCGATLSVDSRFCSACGRPAGQVAGAPAAAGAAGPIYIPPTAPATPLDYRIEGDNLQILRIRLVPGQEVYAEAGKFVYKTVNTQMDTRVMGTSLGEKIVGALKRRLAGESVFTTHFTAQGGTAEVGFAGNYPGRLEAITLDGSMAFLAQRDSFVCAQTSVQFSIAFQRKIGAGLFGGEGFILERFSGAGTVFIHGGGDFVHFKLAAGEVLQVDTGCIVGFDESVSYDIQFAGGIKTALFGGEGLFLATLRGPGKAILQTLTLSKLRRELGVLRSTKGGERRGFGVIDGILSSEDS
ncbi:MAG: AIM24 family protein [Acidobacteriota bacterium]